MQHGVKWILSAQQNSLLLRSFSRDPSRPHTTICHKTRRLRLHVRAIIVTVVPCQSGILYSKLGHSLIAGTLNGASDA